MAHYDRIDHGGFLRDPGVTVRGFLFGPLGCPLSRDRERAYKADPYTHHPSHNILTLGLFTFVINALLILLTSSVIKGFMVSGFWVAMLFSIVLSIVNYVLEPSFRDLLAIYPCKAGLVSNCTG